MVLAHVVSRLPTVTLRLLIRPLVSCSPWAPLPFLFSALLGRHGGGEVFHLEDWTQLDLAVRVVRIGATLDPCDCLIHRLHLPDPVAGNELLCFSKRAVHDRHFGVGVAEPL